MGDIWIDRLSEYLDGELNEVDREAIEQHLARCAECRSTLEQLRSVVREAGALRDEPPEHSIWEGIAVRIGTTESTPPDVVDIRTRRTGRRVITFSVPQLVAAGIALVALSSGTAWFVQSRESQARLPFADAVVRDATAQTVLVGFDVAEYDAAVAELEGVLEQARERLDPSTVQVLEQSLATIDRAIQEAQDALRRDPANPYLTTHLAATMKRKVDLLQRAVAIASGASS
jgi:anti-sigma factor RsiW